MTTTESESSSTGALLNPMNESGRRVLFYSHDGTGLGHLRITLGVATAYAKLRPQDSLLLLTGALQAGAFDLPVNLDYVKIPAMPKRDLYASLPPTEGFSGSHNSTIRIRSAIAMTTLQAFNPHLVVVDHAPGGLFQELAPAIRHLRSNESPPRFALLMRDITFGPEQTRSIWKNEGVLPLLDEAYDRILIYGDRQIFDPVEQYAMSDAAASRSRFCGYLAPLPPLRSPETVRHELGIGTRPLVAVSVGGGADGGPLLRAFLGGLQERGDESLFAYVVSGPLLPDDEHQAVKALAADLANVRLVEFDPDYAAIVRAADVVVGMGGYNSVAEAVYFGKRPVIVPRIPGPEEQILRAEGFARLGLATVVPPKTLDADRLWAAIERELRGVTISIQPVPFDGLNHIASELAELVTT